MPYMFQNLDPYDPRRKDQLRADFDAPAAGFGQMEYGEDYLPPPPPIQGAPVAPPKPPSALEQLQQINAKRPTIAEPAYKPKPLERILGGVAGAGLGFAEGYLNSGRRGPVVRPGTGAMVADAITNRRFNRAEREWNQEAEKAKGAADIESAVERNKRDTEYNAARIESEKAQGAAAKAREARYNAPPPSPRPIDHDPSKALIDPETGKVLIEAKAKPEDTPATIEKRINAIRMSDVPKDEQDTAVNTAVADYNALHPRAPVTRLVTDDSGMVRVVTSDAKGGAPTVAPVGRIGKTKSEPAAMSNRKDRQQVESEANALLQQNGGDFDKAIAAASDLDVKDRLTDSKNKARVANGSGKGDVAARIKAMINKGGNAPASSPAPAAPPASGLPPQAVAQLKEGVETAFRNGQVWTLKDGQPVKVR
jgi:hypothetical protein